MIAAGKKAARLILFTAALVLGSAAGQAAFALGCPTGTVEVGTNVATTGTATDKTITTEHVCQQVEDYAACKELQYQIDAVAAAARSASVAADIYSFYDQTGGWLGKWRAPPGFTLLSNDISNDRKMFPGMSDRDITDLMAPAGSAYRAAIYRDDKTGSLVLAFRGTSEQNQDWTSANIPNELRLWTDYFAKARGLGRALKQYADKNGLKLEIVGHSLGGGMATAAALAGNAKATVFNAEAFRSGSFESGGSGDEALAKSLVTNYVTPYEVVTQSQNIIGAAWGEIITLPVWPGAPLPTPSGMVERHLMRNVRLAIQNQMDVLKKNRADAGCVP